MYPTTILEWWFDGQWREIGWRADAPQSAAALRKHGQLLAAEGGHYAKGLRPGRPGREHFRA